MLYPNPNFLLYIGAADASALAVEYVDPLKYRDLIMEVHKLERYCVHPKYELGRTRYTDDTEMSAANIHVLIDNDPPYTEEMHIEAWIREFEYGGQRKGYSRNFQPILERVKTVEQFRAQVHPNSYGNGAAMRAVPYGVLCSVQEVLDSATLQARITHLSPDGLFSARAVALMSHFAFYESTPFHCFIEEYCLKNLPKEDIDLFGHVFNTRWIGPVVSTKRNSIAVNTVHAAVHLLTNYGHLSLRDILREVILLGGDTDSVAAITLGIAGIRSDSSNTGLPAFMFTELENGDPKTGAKYLLDLGTQLINKFNK